MPGRTLLRWCAGVAALLTVLVSPHLGRAEPTGSYRPDLPPDALTSGCYPLPTGVVIDQHVLPHQVRWDGDVGDRRVLVGQYDLVGEATARDRLIGAFEAAGFTEAAPGVAGGTRLTRPDVGDVDVRLTPLADLPADSAVRGSFVLDLPSVPLAPGRQDERECTSPYSDQTVPVTSATKILLALAAAHVLLKIALFPQVAHNAAFGDEAAYLDGGRALSNLVRDLAALQTPDGPELRQDVVGSGWFMPGMSLLLTPLFLLVPQASTLVVHAYLGVLTTALFLAVVAQVRRHLGDGYAGALLVVPGLVPAWVIFGFAAYGDLCAGLVGVALLIAVLALVREVRAGAAPGWRDAVRLGLLAVAAVYLRSSATLVVAGAFGALLLTIGWLLRGRVRRHGVAAVAVASAALVAGLLPWSIAASSVLGERVVTTTSVPTALANTFGDRDEVCFGPCDPGSTIWFNPLRYSREVARATGRSEVEVQAEMSAYARRDVTPRSYSRDVLQDLRRYVQHPAAFATYLSTPGIQTPADADGYGSARGLEGVVHTGVVLGTDLLFFPALAAGALALLVTYRRRVELQVTSILLKLGLGALLVQPFVHLSGSRYWMTAGPLLGLAVGLLWAGLASRRERPWADDGERVLFVAQAILSAVTGIVAVGVLCLSA